MTGGKTTARGSSSSRRAGLEGGKGVLKVNELSPKRLQRQLRDAPSLQIVRISRGTIDVDVAEALGKTMAESGGITELDLRGATVTAAGAATLSGALRSSQRLRTDDPSVSVVVRALVLQRDSTSFKLKDAQVGKTGVAVLREWLASPAAARVTELALVNCGLGDEGVVELISEQAPGQRRGMWFTAPLRRMDLSRNNIGDRGAQALAKVFASHMGPLRELKLEQNRIGDSGVIGDAPATRGLQDVLHSLNELNLAGTRVGDGGASALSKVLQARVAAGVQLDLTGTLVSVKWAYMLSKLEASKWTKHGAAPRHVAFEPKHKTLVGRVTLAKGKTAPYLAAVAFAANFLPFLVLPFVLPGIKWGESVSPLASTAQSFTVDLPAATFTQVFWACTVMQLVAVLAVLPAPCHALDIRPGDETASRATRMGVCGAVAVALARPGVASRSSTCSSACARMYLAVLCGAGDELVGDRVPSVSGAGREYACSGLHSWRRWRLAVGH